MLVTVGYSAGYVLLELALAMKDGESAFCSDPQIKVLVNGKQRSGKGNINKRAVYRKVIKKKRGPRMKGKAWTAAAVG